VSHARQAVSCATCDEQRVRGEIIASLLLYRVNVLPFLSIESTQLKQCIEYRRL
jgi:hypothetical protein